MQLEVPVSEFVTRIYSNVRHLVSTSLIDELMTFGPHGQNRTRGGTDNVFGNTPHQKVSQPGASVSADHDEVDFIFFGIASDSLTG